MPTELNNKKIIHDWVDTNKDKIIFNIAGRLYLVYEYNMTNSVTNIRIANSDELPDMLYDASVVERQSNIFDDYQPFIVGAYIPKAVRNIKKIASILTDPENIKNDKHIQYIWTQMYKKLYNTDIDLITEYCTDAEFDRRADVIVAYINARTGLAGESSQDGSTAECTKIKKGSDAAYRWRITSNPPIDLYRNTFGCVFRYHLPVVRQVQQNSEGFLYTSAALALVSGYCQDRRWCRCAQSFMEVNFTYASRHFLLVINDIEKTLLDEYKKDPLITTGYPIYNYGCEAKGGTYSPGSIIEALRSL